MVDVDLGPCDGRLYMVSPTAIDRVRIWPRQRSPAAAKAIAASRSLIAAGRPMEVDRADGVSIRDSESRAPSSAATTQPWTASGGSLDIAANDAIGYWQIEVRELASGRAATQGFQVPAPDPWPPAGSRPPKPWRTRCSRKGRRELFVEPPRTPRTQRRTSRLSSVQENTLRK